MAPNSLPSIDPHRSSQKVSASNPTPSAARIRENQRRSRARRKEYLQELEQKLRKCEQAGVKASVDIQLAARGVALENKRLKDENERLREEGENLRGENERMRAILEGKQQERAETSIGGTHVIGASSRGSEGIEPEVQLKDSTDHQVDERTTTTKGEEIFTQLIRASPNPPPKVPCASRSNETVLGDDTSSCEYAAHIITSMRADITTDDIRADLGCGGDIRELRKCKVDNLKLFVAVDRHGENDIRDHYGPTKGDIVCGHVPPMVTWLFAAKKLSNKGQASFKWPAPTMRLPQGHPFYSFAISFSALEELFCVRHGKEERNKQYLPEMTRDPPGHNLSSGDSANVPINEAMSVTKDGPEGHSEDGQTGESEDDRTEAQISSSSEGYSEDGRTGESEDDRTEAQVSSFSNTSSESEAENYRKHEHVTGTSEAGTESTPDSPRVKQRSFTLQPSLFGSPLAYASYQDKHDFFKGLLPESTRVLFDQIVAEASTLRERLLTEPTLLDNGCNGRLCALKERRSWTLDSDITEESENEESKLQLYGFGIDDNRLRLPLHILANSTDSSSSTPSENSNPEVTIEVRRVQDSENGEVEYFVVNGSLDLRINGMCVEPAVIAGPLPDFAVIEFTHSSFFWWRTATALDYVPSLKRKRSLEDDDGEASRKAFKGDTEPPPNLQVFPDSRTWLDEYRRRLRVCKRRPIKYTSSITELHPPHQYPAGEMHDTDVILAIGAVWLGLIEAKVDFAYANSDFFSFARSMRMVGMHAVKETKPFLIPLLFNEELQALSPESGDDTAEPLEPAFSAFQRGEEEKHQESFAAAEEAKQKDPGNKNRPPPSLEDQEVQNRFHKGGIGHFMLAIAEKVSRGGPNTLKDVLARKALVRLRFMDSAKGIVDKGMIRRVARNTVRISGWLGDIWPRFDVREEYWEDVLVQSGNRCGEHTVLNAWAYMLEIPLATTRDRALGTSSYNEVRRMILLALRGQLDSLTIRAWMQHSKYAVDEPLSQLQQTQQENPDLPNNIRNMQTVALNEDAFNEIVCEMYTQEQAENQALATRWGAVAVESGGASTQQLEHTAEVAGRVTLPPSSQDSVAGFSGTHGTSATPNGPAKSFSPARPSTIRSPRTWRESLVRGLANNKALKAKNIRTTEGARKDASVIPSFSNMADYDVILGIAPIWEGLKRLRRADFDFTYAGMDVFAPGGGQKSIGAVGRWSRFIMPLFFSPVDDEILEYQGDGNEQIQSVGHLVLCVAELVNDQPMTVQLHIFDSRPGTVPVPTMMRKAQEIINRSDWLDANGSKAPVLYRRAIVMRTPRQVGSNTCGLHVILNAWTYMLGIAIHPYKLPRGRTEEDEGGETDYRFLNGGLEMVNLALAGFMDSATIQAFFNVYGYSVEQRFGDPARAVIPVNAVGMNQEKLLLTLQKRQAEDALTSARAENKTFPDEDMAYLMGGDMNEEQAWTALAVARGDREEAIDWHFSLSPRGVLPRPEDALSPKTPNRRRKSS